MAQDNVIYDINGYDIVTKALRELLNQFPALEEDEEISFSLLNEEDGKAFFPVSGAIITDEIKDITGHVEQTCTYPFIVIYKAGGLSQSGKQNAKEWLDHLGKWLEGQEIEVDGITYQLTKYPPLNGNMRFTDIKRTTTSYLMETSESMVDSWAVNISAQYKNEYDKRSE